MNNIKLNNIDDLQRVFADFITLAKDGKKSALLTHINPDGDGLAACLALKSLFSELNIQVDIVLDDESLDKLDYLDVQKNTIFYSENLNYSQVIIVDCHGYDRLGRCADISKQAESNIVIDHHEITTIVENSSYYIDSQSACVGMIIFDMIEPYLNDFSNKANQYIASALYTTIINDTNNFLNTNVSEKVFSTCAKLMKYNIVPSSIAQNLLYRKSPDEFVLIGDSLATAKTYFNDRVLIYYTDRIALDKNNLPDEATSKMTQWSKGVTGVEIAMYYRHTSKGNYKFSIRSEKYNVLTIAEAMGGGGHKSACGFTVEKDLEHNLQIILELIKKEFYGN